MNGTLLNTTSRTALALEAAIAGEYNVRFHGRAKGDGVADDTQAIDTTIAAMTAAGGGVLVFPRGTYKTSGGHVISVDCTIRGQGNGFWHDNGSTGYWYPDRAVSLIQCTSATAYCFTFATPHVRVEHLCVQCTAATPTAGGGFLCAGDGGAGRLFSRYRFQDVTILDGFYGIEHAVGAFSKFYGVICVGQRKYSFFMRNDANTDVGDCTIFDCVVCEHGAHDTEAAIRYESGGGLRVLATKIVGGKVKHGVWLYFGDGKTSGQLRIEAGTSIDNISGNAVRLETAGTGQFNNVIISSPFFNTIGTDFEPIYINNGGAGASLGTISIDGGQIISRNAPTLPIVTVTGNGGVSVRLGNFSWGGATGTLFTKGVTDTVSQVLDPVPTIPFDGKTYYDDTVTGSTAPNDNKFLDRRGTVVTQVGFADVVGLPTGHGVPGILYTRIGGSKAAFGVYGVSQEYVEADDGGAKRWVRTAYGGGNSWGAWKRVIITDAPPTLPANATDLASAIALVNALKSMAIGNGQAT